MFQKVFLYLLFTLFTLNAQVYEHVQNGTFDSSLAQWDLWGAAYHTERQCAYVQNDSAKWSGLSQIIIIPKNAHSMRIKGSMVNVAVSATSQSWESAQITFEYLDDCGSVLMPYPQKVASRTATREWTQFSRKYTLREEATQIKLIAALGNVTGRAWFDSLSVTFYDKYRHKIPYDSTRSVTCTNPSVATPIDTLPETEAPAEEGMVIEVLDKPQELIE